MSFAILADGWRHHKLVNLTQDILSFARDAVALKTVDYRSSSSSFLLATDGRFAYTFAIVTATIGSA